MVRGFYQEENIKKIVKDIMKCKKRIRLVRDGEERFYLDLGYGDLAKLYEKKYHNYGYFIPYIDIKYNNREEYLDTFKNLLRVKRVIKELQ